MDSVPFTFCLDVMERLNANSWNYQLMEESLTGRWKAAAKRYVENVHNVDVFFNCRDGVWEYSTTVDQAYEDRSLDDLLAMNRRFVRCRAIYVHHAIHPIGYYTTCTKEEIFNRLIPFMVQQSRSFRTLSFHHSLSREDARTYFDLFRSCRGFGFQDLDLPYFGEETEQFLSACLEHNLKCLTLDTSWPQSQAVEDLILKFLSAGIMLTINERQDGASEAGLKLSPKILKAVLEAWDKAVNLSFFNVTAPWHDDLELILSIPLPPNVSRTEPKTNKHKSVVMWSKEDGSVLSCSLYWEEHFIRFRSPPYMPLEDLLKTDEILPLP
uniref:Sugar phosphate phosphatase n=1 Tax=Steinernema glaseri TaxID=37863 RepID=A0A1I7YF04_9BILA